MATSPAGPTWFSHSQTHLVNTASLSRLRFFPHNFKTLCALLPTPKKTMADVKVRVQELKEGWLDSLSCPFEQQELTHYNSSNIKEREENGFGKWVVGIDPDVHGALALLKDDDGGDYGVSAQVFDTPHLPVLVGKRVRKRLDARSIVQLLHSFGAPIGATAYIEQSNPFPQDGKQGWWSGGFTYGLWIGILVSSGFSVVPVASRLWKDQFQLYQNFSTKDDSRRAASDLFPSLSSSLRRKKDHGRADALLIAAYGKGIKIQSKAIDTSNEASLPPLSLEDNSINYNEVLEPINIKALL